MSSTSPPVGARAALRPVRAVLGRARRSVRRVVRRALRRYRPSAGGVAAAGTRQTRVDGLLATALGADPPVPARPQVRLATLVGPRLAAGLAWEVSTVELRPADWREQLQPPPDVVLAEVQAGAVPGWTGRAAELAELAETCADLPLVVWVTDAAPATPVGPAGTLPAGTAELVAAARRVLAVDEDGAAALRELLPGTDVGVLGAAAQPRRHPLRPGGGAAREPLGCVLVDPPAAGDPAPVGDPALDLDLPRAALFPRDFWPVEDGSGRARPVPAAVRDRVAHQVDAAAAGRVIGGYRVLLDIGRGDPASTWSVLEAAAAGTAVVTFEDRAARLPPEIAAQVGTATDPRGLVGALGVRINQCELRDRETTRMHRAVLAGHTIRHRVDTVLAAAGRPVPARDRSVSAVVPTNRDHELANVLDNLGRQQHDAVQLVLVLHGLAVDEADLRARAKDAGVSDLVLVQAGPTTTLGACMNLGVAAADGRYLAKMDDDNYYGRHYLGDLVAAFDYTRAGIVGKWGHYVWLRSSGAVVLRHAASEHSYERRVQGGSMLFDGDLVRDLGFSDIPRAVDTDILDRALAQGVEVYSTDRYNFVSIRGADPGAHTWTVGDHTFMTRKGQLIFYGDPREHVDV